MSDGHSGGLNGRRCGRGGVGGGRRGKKKTTHGTYSNPGPASAAAGTTPASSSDPRKQLTDIPNVRPADRGAGIMYTGAGEPKGSEGNPDGVVSFSGKPAESPACSGDPSREWAGTGARRRASRGAGNTRRTSANSASMSSRRRGVPWGRAGRRQGPLRGCERTCTNLSLESSRPSSQCWSPAF